MKISIKIILLSLFLPVCINAQEEPPETGPAREKIESIRIAFLTDKLDLSPQESQAFWPVYNDFNDELRALRKDHRPPRDLATLTDEEAENLVMNHLEMQQKEIDLKRAYVEKLKKVIPIRKIALLEPAEREFKAKLLERIRQERQEHGGRRPGLKNR